MKKIVLTLDLMDNKAKQKALKTVSTLHGIDSITMEMNTKKLTVTGAVDPVSLVTKLRKYWPETTIVLVGPVKEPEKPAPEKKPEESGGGGGGGDKKETGGGGGDKKPEGDGKKEGAGGDGGEKKDGEKKGDSTKEGEKKEGDGDGKKEGEKTVAKPVQPMVAPPVYFHMPPPQMQYPDMMRGYRPNYYYNSAPHPAQMSMYHHQQQHYYSPSVEENPNACTIC